MEARPRKRTARERIACVRGKMRSRGERATATEVSSTEVPAADVEAATTKPAAATVEAATATMEATAAMKATAAAATMATTASSMCRDRQDDRASQHGSARGEFRPEFQYGHRHDSLPRNQEAPHRPQPVPLFQSNKRQIVPIPPSNPRVSVEEDHRRAEPVVSHRGASVPGLAFFGDV